MRRSLRKLVVLASLLALLGATVPVATAAPPAACTNRNNNTIKKLLECVDVEGVREHQAAFQAIADANGGTRASGTSGYDESAAYVAERMEAAGYDVTIQPFDFVRFTELSPAILEQVAPAQGAGPIPNIVMSYSGSGDVTAPVTVVPNVGCEPADFTGFPVGSIALISRGTCPFAQKATNAFNAEAGGVVIYNNIAGDLNGTLGSTFDLEIGVTGITMELGQQLATTDGLELRLFTDTLREPGTTSNVLAEKVGKNPDNVVMVGAHLDSVPEGPGINDNGSGSGAILEVAEQMAKVKPQNTLRFAWWGAEEASLVGSNLYVSTLSEEELAKIALYLNFDMVGSPNHVFFIYDGDDSDAEGAGPGPAGSDLIEQKFEEFFETRDIPFKGTDFSGRSDYQAFILSDIPAGGLFTGAEGIKTAEEAAVPEWGGVAGEQYDQCYHAVCDTFDNVNLFALDTNSDAIAYATLSYAMSTEEINGVPGKGNFKAQQLDEEATPDAA